MSKIENGKPRAIAAVPEHVPMDEFENAIRKIGVVNACEWFGHAPDSEFTREIIKVLQERATELKGRA